MGLFGEPPPVVRAVARIRPFELNAIDWTDVPASVGRSPTVRCVLGFQNVARVVADGEEVGGRAELDGVLALSLGLGGLRQLGELPGPGLPQPGSGDLCGLGALTVGHR